MIRPQVTMQLYSNQIPFLSKGKKVLRKIPTICLLIAALSAYDTIAQVQFTRKVPDSPLIADKPFRIQYNFEGEDRWHQAFLPLPRECSLLDSTEENHMSFPAGKKELQKGWTKTYIVSFPRPGTFLLPAAYVQTGGRTLKVPSLPIHVVSRNNYTRKEVVREEPLVALDENSLLKKGESPEKKVPKHIFIAVESNKSSCVIGEDVAVNYKLFIRVHASSEVMRRPSFPGCTVIDMMKSYDAEPEIEWRNGSAYYTYLIRKAHIFPLREGRFVLDEAEISTVVHFKKEMVGSDSLQALDFPATIRSTPQSIEVKPVPRFSPSNQNDMAVGRFSIAIHTDKSIYQPGELAEASVRISGAGNWPMINAPLIQWPRSLQLMGPEITERYDASTYPLKGDKTFLYKFITPDTGIFHFPSVSINYFDPVAFRYGEAHSTPFHITISKKRSSTLLTNERSVTTPLEKGNELVFYYFGGLVLLALGWIAYNLIAKK